MTGDGGRATGFWAGLSLAQQFALAGGLVMVLATGIVGLFVAQRIEDAVVRNTANATALYMESFIAPLTQDLASAAVLSAASKDAIQRLLVETPLGQRVVSFKIWVTGGRIVAASDLDIVGKQFDVTEDLRGAWQGSVMASFNDLSEPESAAEQAMGLPLLEIYAPIRERGSGRVIGVAEFYEIAIQLRTDLNRARAVSWAAVALVMAVIGASLFVIVLRGSRTIDRQVEALTDLSARNVTLRLRVQGAAARFSAMNDQALRRIGADLHDGPAQLMGFAALRLDGLRGHLAGPAAKAEVDSIERAVKDAIREIRNISRGVSLPDIERRPMGEVIAGLVDAHQARTGTEVDLAVDLGADGGMALPIAVKICLGRVVQEGLNNAWRHAGGLGQEVAVAITGRVLTARVADGGPGVAAHAVGAGDSFGLGLAGLAGRVESLGGSLILSARQGGVQGMVLDMVLDLGEVE